MCDEYKNDVSGTTTHGAWEHNEDCTGYVWRPHWETDKQVIDRVWEASKDERGDWRAICGYHPVRECLVFVPQDPNYTVDDGDDGQWVLWLLGSDYRRVSAKEAHHWLYEQGKSACWIYK
jgi:hypothetical protein